MYRIIGADGKEYGPISKEQLLQWIAENRANVSTQALAEGGTEWKPLGSFPEFALAFGAKQFQPAAFAPTGTKRNSGYATASMILGIVSVFSFCCCSGLPLNVLAIVFALIALSEIKKNPQLEGRGMAISGLILGIVSLVSGLAWALFFGMASVFGNMSNEIHRL